MGRIVQKKETNNARLLKEYASWIYCTACEKTVAYLCYVTYDTFDFRFACDCGTCGSVYITFGELDQTLPSEHHLIELKNRLCCPADQSPLLTIVDKNLRSYSCRISCKACGYEYSLLRESEVETL